MIYALTGYNGFIGTALAARLVKENHVVYPIEVRLLGSVDTMRAHLDNLGVDIVIHLAAYGNHYNQNEHKEILRSNILYTLNVFKAAGDKCKVINFSTSSVLLPVRTLYSISKRAGEEIAKLFPQVFSQLLS